MLWNSVWPTSVPTEVRRTKEQILSQAEVGYGQAEGGWAWIAPGLASIRGRVLSNSIWMATLSQYGQIPLSLPKPGLSPLYSKPANNMLLTILRGQTLDKLVPTRADSPTAGSALPCDGGCFGYIILSSKFIILSLKINYSCQQGAV